MPKKHLDSIVSEVVRKFEARAEMGYAKYNKDLDRTDLSIDDWLQHAQEEAMDFILYITKIRNIIIDSAKEEY